MKLNFGILDTHTIPSSESAGRCRYIVGQRLTTIWLRKVSSGEEQRIAVILAENKKKVEVTRGRAFGGFVREFGSQLERWCGSRGIGVFRDHNAWSSKFFNFLM